MQGDPLPSRRAFDKAKAALAQATPARASTIRPPAQVKPAKARQIKPKAKLENRYSFRIRNSFHWRDGDCEMDAVEFTSRDVAMAYRE